MEKSNNISKINREEELKKLLLNDDYILWLSKFMEKYNDIDDIYFVHNNKSILNEKDLLMIEYLQYLFLELNKFVVKNYINYKNIFSYLLKYDNRTYLIKYNGEGYSCTKYNSVTYIKEASILPCIDYKELKKQVGHQMQVNFELLKERVIDSLEQTDLEYIRSELIKLKEPTIFSGVGGSNVVSEFGSKVINKKNGIISINSEPRDFIYRNNDNFKNVVACSYSGNNFGVELSFSNELKKFLLSNNSYDNSLVTYLKYNTTIAKEKSFISLGASLIPISILMDYYLDGKDSIMLESIHERTFNFNTQDYIYEIFSGYDTSTASKYLESTMVEAGIGIPIVHDKYSYCHGRSTIGINYSGTAIYFDRNTEFDKIMKEELKKYYNTIIVIESRYKDQILDDYQMLIQCMYLTKYLAEKQSKDLSKVDHSPIVKKLYKYNGKI